MHPQDTRPEPAVNAVSRCGTTAYNKCPAYDKSALTGEEDSLAAARGDASPPLSRPSTQQLACSFQARLEDRRPGHRPALAFAMDGIAAPRDLSLECDAGPLREPVRGMECRSCGGRDVWAEPTLAPAGARTCLVVRFVCGSCGSKAARYSGDRRRAAGAAAVTAR